MTKATQDIRWWSRNLQTPRVSMTPAERACAVERHKAAASLVPPVIGFLLALVAAVAVAQAFMERMGL